MNDERPIEKLLRRYANKRRDESGPPPELHPATRRMLQGEVARQFPKPRPAESARFWAILRARWIYATACVVVLGAGAVLLLPSLREDQSAPTLASQEAEMTLAKATPLNDEKLKEDALKKTPADKMEVPVNTPAPAAAATVSQDAITTLAAAPRTEPTTQLTLDDRAARRLEPPPPVALAPRSQPTTEFKSARETPIVLTARTELDRFSKAQPEQPASLTPVLAAKEVSSPGLAGASRDSDAGKDLALAERQRASPPPARVATGAAPVEMRTRKAVVARGGGLEREERATVSQAFSNLAPASGNDQKQKAAPTTAVLVNFRVEQTGDQLRVVDGDGSTYFGTSPVVAVDAAAVTSVQKGAAPVSQTASYYRQAGEALAAGRYLYRVEGTNRTLKQPVSFAWNFVAPTNPPGATQAYGGAVPGSPAPWVDSAINGRVQINTGAQFELNATPIKR